MPPLAMILLLASAALHAAWNVRGKGRRSGVANFAAAEILVAILLIPLWPWAIRHLLQAPTTALILIVLSSACQGLYYLGLSRAYAAGDLGVAYPLIRTLPVVILAGVTLVVGTTPLSPMTICGIALTTVGAGLLSLRRRSDAKAPGQAMAVAMTVCLVVGYTSLDAQSLPAIRHATDLGPLATALAVIPFMALGNGLFALGAAVTVPVERRQLRALRDRRILGEAALMGAAIWGSYGLALAAMSLDVPASMVASLRLVSVPLGFLLAVVRFGEPLTLPRISGTVGVVIGVLLVMWR